jgi:preprotein translocase subunit SecG
MDRFSNYQNDIFKLEIDQDAKNSFLDMARWTKFLAILGIVMLCLLLALGVFFSLFINKFAESYGGASPIAGLGSGGPVIIMAFFVIIVGIYVYPTMALLKYASGIKIAIATDNKAEFNKAIKYLKNMFRYTGILAIIMIGLYILQVVVALTLNTGH